MGATGFVRYAGSSVRENGVDGIRMAVDELRWSLHRRARSLHWLTTNTKTVTISGETVRFRRQTASEWDHMRAIALERPMLSAFLDDLQPTDTVWDVGGNVGSWACFGASRGASVVTFEPVEANRRALARNVARNGLGDRVDVRSVALSNEAGIASFTLDNRCADGAGAGRGSLLDDWQDGAVVEVETARGDEVAADTPDVLKVDVEGAEAMVLDGLGDLLGDVRVAFVELHRIDDERALALLNDAGLSVTFRESGMVRAER
ncbi:FkbM family methyltransferase [Halomarina oriensis]|uniref:FkbM family methyltransferase n=1 Tax=Halomarina oriensis TaxID=671145 RepID=A0A6B0GGN5_9EURY|nr:FkbM family methyltransferase [Halomarina oriensis]MWG33127.1 FkbM family methyltransferase [Halomarina oriensis]